MMFWYGNGMSGFGYLLMTVSMVLFWGAVIIGVIALTRYLSHTSRRPVGTPHPTAEQLLADRFARGEIDEREYRSRLGALRGEPPLD